MIASSKLSNDALAITNDRLQLEIDKLEKKPQNRMALALDQMRDASDKLFDSLEKSNKAFDEAMGKGGIGTSSRELGTTSRRQTRPMPTSKKGACGRAGGA